MTKYLIVLISSAKVRTFFRKAHIKMSLIKSKGLPEIDDVMQAVARAITQVQQQTGYGSIEVTVHDGRVTQIERREKVRFEQKTK